MPVSVVKRFFSPFLKILRFDFHVSYYDNISFFLLFFKYFKTERDSFLFYCMLFDSFSISFDFFRHFFKFD